MKFNKLLPFLSIVLFLLSITILVFYKINTSKVNIAELRQRHEQFLRNSPFKETLKLSKKERKANGLPPNKYMERQWELTMNPATGKPEPKKLIALQEQLRKNALFAKVPGENTNNWVERGPNNVGGRTRAIMFDPNDTTNKRVFAGGVSGGLWVNNDITNVNSSWNEVNIPKNLAISCITYDPNNTNIFYVGTGESYVQGAVNGNGLWKSSNGGISWVRVFGGVTGETTFSSNAKVTVNSPSIIVGEYAAVQASYDPPITNITGNLVLVDDNTASPTLGCNTLTNAFALNGKIAVVERGSCNFTVKTQNAQNAGAIAVLIVNNIAGPPIIAGGTDPGTFTIPTIMISKSDGLKLISQLSTGVNVTLQPTTAAVAGSYITPGIHHINDVIVRNNDGVSEVYLAASSAFYKYGNPLSIFGIEDYGLYKSSDKGFSWAKIGLPLTTGGSAYQTNDLEISIDNTVWISTTSNLYGAGGGTILSSLNGISFTVKKIIPNGDRTQIALSRTDPNKIFALAEMSSGTNGVSIIKTINSFLTDQSTALPKDIYTGIPPTDFTNGQAFYDLLIEVDPTNDQIVYVGGIDLFRTKNGGDSWTQISEYYSNTLVNDVHPDHHALVFNPTDPTIAVNGNDGGVYYGTSLSTTSMINSRNKNYNTLQFYKGAIGQESGSNQKLLAGSQDNGSQLINNASAGINGSTEVSGGDGGYCFIDTENEYMITSYVYNNFYYLNYSTGAFGYTIVEDDNTGDFINPSALDYANNILYTNGSSGSDYKINRYVLRTSSATTSSITNALLNGSPTAFKPSTYSSTKLFVGTDNGRLLKITNANASAVWEDITGPDFYGSISNINLGASDLEIFVTFYNYGVTSIYYTSDGGSTWQNKEGNLPDLPVRAIMRNPLNSNEVIIGTDLGVWGTADFSLASPVWSQAQNGMKDIVVTSFDLRTSDHTVLASTYGRGMFTGQFTEDDSSLSIEDNILKNSVKVFPTSSNGQFKISASNEIKKGNLNIFDLNGKEVYKTKLNFNNNRIQDISINVSAGMYILKFTSDNKQLTQKILIK